MARFLAVAAGAIVGLFVGYILAILWVSYTGNLMMPQPEYEQRGPAIRLTISLIVGLTAIVGSTIGFFWPRSRKRN